MAVIRLKSGEECIVDDDDLPVVSRMKWYAKRKVGNTYALAKGGILMHRVIMGAGRGQIVDHIDGNGLNNRRGNLRFATHSQNSQNRKLPKNNTSGAKGVYWDKSKNAWRARIWAHGEEFFLGTYASIDAASAAYCDAAKRLHGEFARLA
jgi:hypothetical protein